MKVSDLNGYEEVNFPTEREVKIMDPSHVDGALSLALIRLTAMSFHVLVSLISVTEWVSFFIRYYYSRTVWMWIHQVQLSNFCCLPYPPQKIHQLWDLKENFQTLNFNLSTSFMALLKYVAIGFFLLKSRYIFWRDLLTRALRAIY